jgi:hypothetical protein
MKKPILYGLVASVAVLGISYSIYYIRHHPRPEKSTKSVEEILKERAEYAANALNAPLGQALLKKDWPQFDKVLLSSKVPHQTLANIVRSLFIQNKTQEFLPADIDQLENRILSVLELEPIKDVFGYQLLATQFYRLPLLGLDFSSRKNLETLVHSEKGGPNHAQAKVVGLSKLIMQGVPPSDRDLKTFEAQLSKSDISQWTTVLDAVRHAPTQDRLNQFLVKSWTKLDRNAKQQALSTLSNSFSVPKKSELITFSLSEIRADQDVAMVESSLRYLTALNQKGLLSPDQKKKIFNSLSKIDDSKKSPFLAEKIKEFK